MKICKICLKKVAGTQRFADYHNTCLSKLFESSVVSPLLGFDRTVFKTELTRKYVAGMSISGVQKKLSMKIESGQLVLTNSGGKFILKPSVEDFPYLSENEHLSMLIGKALDIDTPPLGLIKFSQGELVYAIKRFDWKAADKIHKEDMTQIFALQRDEEGHYKYDLSYEQVGVKLNEVTGGKLAVVLDFFNRLVFNFLIHNGDYHLKNISVLSEKLTMQGFYQGLSPNYDSVMTRMYFEDERELALALLKGDEMPTVHQHMGYHTRPDFEQLAGRIGILPSASGIIFDKIRKKKPEIFELIESSFLEASMKHRYLSNVLERLKMLGV